MAIGSGCTSSITEVEVGVIFVSVVPICMLKETARAAKRRDERQRATGKRKQRVEKKARESKRSDRGSERETGNQLCGHYPVFPRWPSRRLCQLASARNNGEGNNRDVEDGLWVRRGGCIVGRSCHRVAEAAVPTERSRVESAYSNALEDTSTRLKEEGGDVCDGNKDGSRLASAD